MVSRALMICGTMVALGAAHPLHALPAKAQVADLARRAMAATGAKAIAMTRAPYKWEYPNMVEVPLKRN